MTSILASHPPRPAIEPARAREPERLIIITGGSSGIGRCTARLFARRGWKIGLIARGAASLDAAVTELRAGGGIAMSAIADVTDSAALDRATQDIVAALGPIDAWINAAGNGVYGRFLDVPEDEYRRVTDVTYMGTVNGTRMALRHMVARGHGTIVNVCSGIAFSGLPLMSSYAGAKAAVRAFGQSIRAELNAAKSRVHVGTVFPPAVNTPFFSHSPSHMGFPSRPVPPVYQPEIVAQGLYLAVTRPRREMTISSIVMAFSLVSRLSPSLAAWLTERLRFDAMLTRDPAARDAEEHSLFTPSLRVLGVHGPFGNRARGWSAQVWLRGAWQGLCSNLSRGLFGRRSSETPPITLLQPGVRLLPEPARIGPDPAPTGSEAPGAAVSGSSR